MSLVLLGFISSWLEQHHTAVSRRSFVMLRTLVLTSLAGKDTNILFWCRRQKTQHGRTSAIDDRSFMYRLNNIGPKMGPCGTPWLTVPCSDRDVPTRVDCWRSVK